MIYASIDVETGGLVTSTHSIIQFACVIEDTDRTVAVENLPRFEWYFQHRDDFYTMSPWAVINHGKLFKTIAEMSKNPKSLADNLATINHTPQLTAIGSKEDFVKAFYEWLRFHYPWEFPKYAINLLGKNLATFDLLVLNEQVYFSEYIKYNHRVFDLGNLYFDPKLDKTPPSMDTIYTRAGITPSNFHNALGDALDNVRLMRIKMGIK